MQLPIKENYALRPDAQAFDEIRIVTVPRYKQSELSGDEWRISSETQFYRKGELVHTVTHGNVQTACGFAYADLVSAVDDGKAYFGGDGKRCDQESCVNLATVKFRLKKMFSLEGFESEPTSPTFRCFCDKHKTRGDCGLEDADPNYEEVK